MALKFTVIVGGAPASIGIKQVEPTERTYSGGWDVRIYVEGELRETLESPCMSDACNYVERYAKNPKVHNMFAIVEDYDYAIAFIQGKGWSDE